MEQKVPASIYGVFPALQVPLACYYSAFAIPGLVFRERLDHCSAWLQEVQH